MEDKRIDFDESIVEETAGEPEEAAAEETAEQTAVEDAAEKTEEGTESAEN